MNTIDKSMVPDYSGNFSNTTTTGAGAGLASVGAAMAKAFAASGGSSIDGTKPAGAGRVLGIEAVSMADALGSRELASTPLLALCQQQLDARIVERSAFKLRARMQGDGKQVGDDAFRDARQAAAVEVIKWRAGVTVTRGADGSDMVTGADADSLEKHVARVAWRALVASLSDDGLGATIQIQGGAEDDWLCPLMLPDESRAERFARHRIEQGAARRQFELGQKMATVGAGRGRRKSAVEKVGNALGLMLHGDTLDTAAAAVGFKARGRHAAGDSLLRAAKRLGLVHDLFTVPRRGEGKRAAGATNDDGARAYPAGVRPDGSLLQVEPFIPAAQPLASLTPRSEPGASRANRGQPAGTHCGAACLRAAIVRGGKGKARRGLASCLVKASSGRGPAASASIDLASLPASPGQLRRVVKAASRRKLRGVLRRVK